MDFHPGTSIQGFPPKLVFRKHRQDTTPQVFVVRFVCLSLFESSVSQWMEFIVQEKSKEHLI